MLSVAQRSRAQRRRFSFSTDLSSLSAGVWLGVIYCYMFCTAAVHGCQVMAYLGNDMSAVAVVQRPVQAASDTICLRVIETLQGPLKEGMLVTTELRVGQQSSASDYGEVGQPQLAVLCQRPDGAWAAPCRLVPVNGSGMLVTNTFKDYLEAMRIPEQGERTTSLLAVSYRALAIPDSQLRGVQCLKCYAARRVMDIARERAGRQPAQVLATAHLAAVVKETRDGEVAAPLFAALYPRITPAERRELLGHIATQTCEQHWGWYVHDVIGKDDELVEQAVVERLRAMPASVGRDVVDRLFYVISLSSSKVRTAVLAEFEKKMLYPTQVHFLQGKLKQVKE